MTVNTHTCAFLLTSNQMSWFKKKKKKRTCNLPPIGHSVSLCISVSLLTSVYLSLCHFIILISRLSSPRVLYIFVLFLYPSHALFLSCSISVSVSTCSVFFFFVFFPPLSLATHQLAVSIGLTFSF